jgi:hypothetical protein
MFAMVSHLYRIPGIFPENDCSAAYRVPAFTVDIQASPGYLVQAVRGFYSRASGTDDL